MNIIFNRRNEYFATYHVLNDNGQRIGILEEHDRAVKSPYWVAWTFETFNAYSGKTESFDTKEAAINHITANAPQQ